MYAVVGCTDCGAYWLLADPDDSETARCPRCRARHRTRKLRRFFESDDREAAREARAALLADAQGDRETFEETASVAEMGERLDDAGVDDREYLEGVGVDADAAAAAGEKSPSRSADRATVVRDALRSLDRPTEDEVVDYAAGRDVPADAARDLLAKLTRRGEASESRGRYRLL